jgi:hypothetical protein
MEEALFRLVEEAQGGTAEGDTQVSQSMPFRLEQSKPKGKLSLTWLLNSGVIPVSSSLKT